MLELPVIIQTPVAWFIATASWVVIINPLTGESWSLSTKQAVKLLEDLRRKV